MKAQAENTLVRRFYWEIQRFLVWNIALKWNNFKVNLMQISRSQCMEISWQNIDTFNQWISIWICACGVEWFVNDFTDIYAVFAWPQTEGSKNATITCQWLWLFVRSRKNRIYNLKKMRSKRISSRSNSSSNNSSNVINIIYEEILWFRSP